MLDRRKIRYTYLKLSKKIKDFLLSDKSREFLIFLFFFLIAGGFWLLQTLNNDYEAEFSIPVRVKDLPNNERHSTDLVSFSQNRMHKSSHDYFSLYNRENLN